MNTGVPGLSNNNDVNHFQIQQVDVDQLNEEKRLLEEQLNIVGFGLTDIDFVPPSPENFIGGSKNPMIGGSLLNDWG
jgi:hypothetical protein